MTRPLAHAVALVALALAPAAMAQTTAPLLLVDANGTVFGRVAGYNGNTVSWAWMDNGPAVAILPFWGSSSGLDFAPLAQAVYFSTKKCTGTAYIDSVTPGAPPSALTYDGPRIVLYVADSPTIVQATVSSYLSGGKCVQETAPVTRGTFVSSAPPLNMRQYYVAPFSLR